MDVFGAFPQAVQKDWKIGSGQKSTISGHTFSEYGNLVSIATIGRSASLGGSQNADVAGGAILLYVRPSSLPTLDTAELVANYVVKSPKGLTFRIMDASEGRNQENGMLEHIELELEAEVVNE